VSARLYHVRRRARSAFWLAAAAMAVYLYYLALTAR
jgi:hypothetical protein